MKNPITVLLLVLAAAGAVMAFKQQSALSNEAPSESTPEAFVTSETATTTPPQIPENGVLVTYFTTDARCPSCVQIERMTRDTMKTHFKDELANGSVVFRTANVDRPENRHFIRTYELVSKTVVVSHRENNQEVRWEPLQDVWRLLGNAENIALGLAAAPTLSHGLQQTVAPFIGPLLTFAIYGIATALPVGVLAMCIALGLKATGTILGNVQKWQGVVRKATGSVILLVGAWLTVRLLL